jgi:hypothetical protein
VLHAIQLAIYENPCVHLRVRAAEVILTEPDLRQMKDATVAALCGVPRSTVRQIRNMMRMRPLIAEIEALGA